MGKTKTTYFCQNCGTQFAKWQGRCSACKQWNTIAEELVQKPSKNNQQQYASNKEQRNSPTPITKVKFEQQTRISTSNNELDRVLGGGLVPGSVTLLGGEPGIGKSTLLLQISLNFQFKTLYISGEESKQQIKMRADRIKPDAGNCYILTETNTQSIFNQTEKLSPEIIIVDSIQTLYSDYIDSTPGSISQIKQTTSELIQFAKHNHIPIILIGHITKEGSIAGPKILEHMVDTVLQFEGDQNHVYRILRAHKNRFGSTNELGIYQMNTNGLQEVLNPSEVLLSGNGQNLSGTAIAATLEGMRPLMIEIQALVSSAVYGTPQRSTTGYNTKRLNMLLAVLEKRAGFKLGSKDVFLNITGGISVDDPAIDLAVIAAILSSNADIAIESNTCFAAEVGLAGEIRPVMRVEQRILEAEKLGFSTIVIAGQSKIAKNKFNIKIEKAYKVEEVVSILFG